MDLRLKNRVERLRGLRSTTSPEDDIGWLLSLVERAVHNAHIGKQNGLRWSHVGQVFSTGSRSSQELCLIFDRGPDEVVGTIYHCTGCGVLLPDDHGDDGLCEECELHKPAH